jgi:hypothetical protein
MPNFTAGTSFTDGVTNDVTALKLNALVADAVPTSSLALTSTNGTIANFTASTANITLGTIPTLTAGTTTGTVGIFTSGTIPTGTFGTTTSTAATITTGTIPTLTTGTTTSTNEVVTNGTITNLSATTSTFLGTITGSTNVVNIGSGQIYKDGSGNVGIGITNPQQLLAVGNGTDQIGAGISGAVSTLYLGAPSNASGGIKRISYDRTNGNLNFIGGTVASSSTQVTLDNNGNVGIGTTSPDAILTVAKSSASTSIGSSTAVAKIINTASTSLNETSGIEFFNNNISGSGKLAGVYGLYEGYNATGYAGALVFATESNGSSNVTERLRIDSSGFVGIGTTSPGKQLSVSGASANFGITSTAAGGNTVSIDPGTTANGNLAQIDCSGANALRFNTNSTERLRIDSSGGVTIAGLAGAGSRAVNASAAGLLSAASDASLKEEVVGAHIAGLNEILQIHPKMYRWKDDIANRGENASIELGFIANDVAPIIPSAAPLGNDGLYGFYDRSITAALVKSVQELKSENDSLKSRIEALEAK